MKVALRVALFGALAFAFVGVGFALSKDASSRWGSAAIGVLSSFSASALFAGATVLLVRSNATEADRLRQVVEEMRNRELHGVQTVCPKYQHRPEFWIELLQSSRDRLDLMGYKLATWCLPTYRPAFVEAVGRLARDGRVVRILVSDLPAPFNPAARPAATATDDVWATYDACRTLVQGLPKKYQSNVDMRTLGSRQLMRYTLVASNAVYVQSPYFGGISSRGAYAFTFRSTSEYAGQLQGDFDSLFSRAQPVPLP